MVWITGKETFFILIYAFFVFLDSVKLVMDESIKCVENFFIFLLLLMVDSPSVWKVNKLVYLYIYYPLLLTGY